MTDYTDGYLDGLLDGYRAGWPLDICTAAVAAVADYTDGYLDGLLDGYRAGWPLDICTAAVAAVADARMRRRAERDTEDPVPTPGELALRESAQAIADAWRVGGKGRPS